MAMAEKKVILPVAQIEKKKKSVHPATRCGGCGSKSCKGGGLGIYPGSEKEIVYRNIGLYIIMGLIILFTSYLIMRMLNIFLS